MNYQAISVTPCSPHIRPIGDIDLTKPLSSQQVAELHEAFTRHLVIFFRDQISRRSDEGRLFRSAGRRRGEHYQQDHR
jgi:alpha-ketoglutarate-dependent taurine dioxygenase